MEAAERVAERVVVELLDSDSDEDNLYDTDEEEGTLRDEHATIDLSLDDDELEELGDELEELGQRAEESIEALYAAAKRHHQRGSLNAQPNRKRARASPAVVVIDDGTSSDDDYDMRVEIRQPCAATSNNPASAVQQKFGYM